MQSVIPNIWFQGDAEEAGVLYASAFSFADASSAIESRYPHEGLLELQRDFAGKPLTVSLTVAGFRFTLINAGSEFAPNPSISFMLNFDPLFFGVGSGGRGRRGRSKSCT
jgi:predicted 3-demethylubiquinone-9 3-methyltransferase (glyoxalase superfamily)